MSVTRPGQGGLWVFTLTCLLGIGCQGAQGGAIGPASGDHDASTAVDTSMGLDSPSLDAQGPEDVPQRDEAEVQVAQSCAEFGSAAERETLDELVEQCVSVCSGQPSVDTCLLACVGQAESVPGACEPCVVDLAVCWIQACGQQCIPGAIDASCLQCLASQCDAPFEQCMGIETASQSGGCLAESDQQSLAPGIDSLVASCIESCSEESGATGCVALCIVAIPGLTPSCTACTSRLGECVEQVCTAACDPSESDGDCLGCVALECRSEFEACTGLHTGVSACTNPSDEQVLSAQSTQELLGMCEQLCSGVDDPMSCGTAYFATAGLGTGCAACHGQLYGCMKGPCELDCAEIESTTCQLCLSTYCDDDFQRCAFVESPPESQGSGCTTDQTEALAQSNFRDVVDGCLMACQGADSPAQCVTQCLVGTTLTEGECLNCVAELGGCVAESCSASCLGGGDEAGCALCTLAACGEAFESCSGLTAGPVDACLDNADKAVIEQENFLGAFEVCLEQCSSAVEGGGCVAECLQSEVGVSALCSSCFAQELVCHGQRCAEACALGGMQDYCGACQAEQCSPAFVRCSGLAESVVAPASCSGLDQAPVESGEVGQLAETCANTCANQAVPGLSYLDCINLCLQEMGLVSQDCATCFASYASCRLNTCTEGCPSEAECGSCVRQQCAQQLSICTGTSLQGLNVPGACMNALDQATLLVVDAIEAVFICGEQCVDAQDGEECVISCAQSLTNLSLGCSGCFVPAFICAQTTCQSACIADPGSVACANCVGTSCYGAFTACAGFVADGAQ